MLYVHTRMHHAECASGHLKLATKIPGGACPQTPPIVKGYRVAYTSANKFAPPDKKMLCTALVTMVKVDTAW